ncbi:hypothetical protein SNOG_07462 [Parastagonospora nodorum SN15]|uniref:Uncharacterized protein n=1 Tax=Phaeosphaeria nodorum (strain SN15 / ATCC MYA-4574 / FGSC 10173) TaxID=321614 RepID=Q0ULA2_PHANO|nr:hypothetical protein SNOG_07462 [Parastagonospora nodorum SN15]EAT84928.1 hypothetical protein SNOG_07462 [Parastagonospora nodorum SN15]
MSDNHCAILMRTSNDSGKAILSPGPPPQHVPRDKVTADVEYEEGETFAEHYGKVSGTVRLRHWTLASCYQVVSMTLGRQATDNGWEAAIGYLQ